MKLRDLFKKETLGEIFRFGIVGVLAVAIHYAIYWLLQYFIDVNIAFTVGYIISFFANYYLSAHFTFREDTNKKNGAGFAGAHIFNYFLQLGLFNAFLWLGVHRILAPFCVFCISVPTNFLVVRFVFKHFRKKD
jgi:putative flippase GtrA